MLRVLLPLLAALLALSPGAAWAQSSNTLSLRGAPAGGVPALVATGVSTNISINLIPKGTGIVLISGAPPAGGSGTANTVPLWTTSTTLGNSPLTLVGSVLTMTGTLNATTAYQANGTPGKTQAYVLCTGAACATSCTLTFTQGILTGNAGTCP